MCRIWEAQFTAPWNAWYGFQAAHVFPLEKESLWIQFNYQRWITNMDAVAGSSKIISIQNGLLLSSEIRSSFDQYIFILD
jgi:HNH endonuclease